MAEPLDTPLDADASSETALSFEPLGIQQPLLPPPTLGQTAPNLQFMVPLGAQPLAVLNPSIFFSEGGSEYAEVGQPFAESPFFDTPHSTVVDRETEPRRAELPHPPASGTLVQRQVAAPTSPASLSSETQPIPVQEQAVEVLGTERREPTGLPDSTVDQPISLNTDTTSELNSAEIAIASDVESSIQRSQEAAPFTPTPPTVSDRSLPTQPDSTPAIPSETQSILQPQQEPSSQLDAASAPSNSALVEAVSDSNASAIESSLHSSHLAESSNETPTVQLAADSPVSEVLAPAPVEPPTIPEPPPISQPIGNEAIQTQELPLQQAEDSFSQIQELPLQQAEDSFSQIQELPLQQAEDSFSQIQELPLQQAEDSASEQLESPTRFSDFLPGGAESPSENSPSLPVSQSPRPLEPPAQSTTPVVQTYSASETEIQRKQVATPQAPELSAAALPTNSLTDLQVDSSIAPSTPDSSERDALTPATPLPVGDISEPNLLQREQVEENLTAPSNPSTSALPETTVNPTGVEPIEDIAIASSEPTISRHPEQIQARFEPAVSQPEAAASPLLDLPTEIRELSSPEPPQPVPEPVRENPATSPTSLFTPPEVTVQRSHSASKLPLPALEQETNAESGTPTPDSPQLIQEPIPSAPTQNTSPQALTPTIQTEAILQPQLDAASAQPLESQSITSLTEEEATPTPETTIQPVSELTTIQRQVTEVPTLSEPPSNPQSLHELVADDNAVIEPAPNLEQSSSVSAPTPIQPEASIQEPSQNAIATESNSLPSTSAQPLESQAITASTEEEATATPEATIQPVSELTTIQRQVTEVPTLSEPPSNPQLLNEVVADNIEEAEPAPTLQQYSSVSAPIAIQPEASVQEPSQNAIATDLTSLASTSNQPLENQAITTLTEEETTPTLETTIQPISESTTIQRQVTEVPALSEPESNTQASDRLVTDSIEATEPTPTLQQSTSVSALIPVQSEISLLEPSQNAIATDSPSLPSTSNQPWVSQAITSSTEEEATPTPEATIQPVSELTTIQRQVTEVSALSEPESNAQASDEPDIVGELTRGLTPPLRGEGSPTPPSLLGKGAGGLGFPNSPTASEQLAADNIEATDQPVSESTVVQRQVTEATTIHTPEEKAIASDFAPNAIVPATDSLSESPPISPTTQESSPGIPSTLPTDSLTSTEPDLIQPFHQPDTTNVVAQPELPTVLQNLTVLNPLGSTPLIQTAAIEDTTPPSEPPTVRVERRELPSPVVSSSSFSAQPVSQTASTSSNQEAVTSVPDEWSSIAELLNRSSSPASHSSSSSPFPDLQPFGATETVIQAQFEPVMRQFNANPAPTSHDEEHSQVTEVKADTEDVAAPSPEQLEKLAREIYGLVRQRLQIEQERSGNSYLGRLPW